jgi:hypothetical protein
VQVTVQGVVRCLEAPCDPSISITLTGTDIESHMTASLSPGEKQEATYAIRDVLPGQYHSLQPSCVVCVVRIVACLSLV